MPISYRENYRVAGLRLRRSVILTAWMAFAWSNPAFPADALNTGAPSAASTDQIGSDLSPELQPNSAEPFPSTDTPSGASPAVKPASSLRLAPIAIGFGGDIGYVIEQRTVTGSNAVLQQRIALNMRGKAKSYIWQPWIAQVNGDLGFNANKAKTDDHSSSTNTISGGVGLGLVPYSRYPFTAYLSRNQQYSGAGIGSLTSHTTRLDLMQTYRPKFAPEFYMVGYSANRSVGSASATDLGTEVTFSMTSDRFKSHSIMADAYKLRYTRSGSNTTRLSSNAKIHHRYDGIANMRLENNAIQTSTGTQSSFQSEISRNRELNSTVSINPSRLISMIGGARVHEDDSGSNQQRSTNANLSAYYRYSEYVTLSASGNLNVIDTSSGKEKTASTTQSANANIPLIDTNLGTFRYSSQSSASVSNRISNYSQSSASGSGRGSNESRQSLSLGVGHNLGKGMELAGGRLSLGLGQSVSLGQATRSNTTSTLTHNATTSWRRARSKGDTSWRLSGRDTRSLSRAQDAFQSVDFSASISEEINRDSHISGSLSVQTTRQLIPNEPKAHVFSGSSASVYYTHERAFHVPRLRFNSVLQAHSTAALPVFAASPEDQGPISWENNLTYNVGKLVTQFSANLTKNSDGSTQSLLSFSVRRYF